MRVPRYPPSLLFFLFFFPSFTYLGAPRRIWRTVSEYTCFPSRASRTCLGYSSGVSSCIYHRYLYPLRVHIVGRCGANRNRRSPVRAPHDLFHQMQASASSSASDSRRTLRAKCFERILYKLRSQPSLRVLGTVIRKNLVLRKCSLKLGVHLE